MKRIDWKSLDEGGRAAALARPAARQDAALRAGVSDILASVRDGGWTALSAIAARLDGEAPRCVAVAEGAARARATLAPEALAALALAAENIRAFHAASVPAPVRVETRPGLVVEKVWRPIDRVGLYVPGGKTPLFSTLLMLALPARAAGVPELVVVTPPRPEGGLDPLVALAAETCGIEAVWTVGGAQAIAALTYGAGDLPRVDKICGPGNAWVAEAKRQAAAMPGGPAIDMPAGPSELLVIADADADAERVAADLLSQAEHDTAAQVLLVTPSPALAEAVAAAVTRQQESLPRAEIARAALDDARILIVPDLDAAVALANAYAPEHLSLAVAAPEALLPAIRNAGAVFAGGAAAETLGDYLAGSSHVLPTDGAARAWSGIGTMSFLKAMSVQRVTARAAATLAGPAATLARLEGLEAHARAADLRAGEKGGEVEADAEKWVPAFAGTQASEGGVVRLARAEVRALPAFDVSADPAFGPDAIRLDANENPFAALAEGQSDLNRYPPSRSADLRKAMAALYGVAPECLLVTRGADDAIDLVLRAFVAPGEPVAVPTPSFGAYAHFVRLQGGAVRDVPLGPDFAVEPDLYVAARPKLAFVCAPNNPTGDDVAPETVLALTEALPDSVIVCDEAYIEFSAMPSLAAEAARRDNLVVLRTLSKAYGLAGARIGCAIARPETIALLEKVLPPYPLPSPSIAAALSALSPSRRAVQEERVAAILAERTRVAAALRGAPGVRRVREGGGNFLFLEVDAPDALAATLRARGIRVRFRPQAAPGGMRLTIGTPAENDAALAAFGIGTSRPAPRAATVTRDTRETQIACAIDLDTDGPRRIDTGVPFFDHMLDQVAAHGGFALTLACEGDLEIDAHHSVEDCAIAFGQALSAALGDRRGIGRFGFALPMDEAAAEVRIDLSGRPFAKFDGAFAAAQIGAYPTEMTAHVFRSLADTLRAAVHVTVTGENDHHKTEACFKALGRALRQALRREGDALPSTKGRL